MAGLVRRVVVWSLAIWLILACVAVAGQEEAAGGPPPALVRLGPVERQQLQARWDVVGRLQEVRRAVVAAEQSGRIVQIQADEGQPVTGQQTVLAKIDDIWARLAAQSAQARLQQAKASVSEAQAQLEQAQRDRAYLEELLEAGSAKPKEVEDARTAQQAQAARLEGARANLAAVQAESNRVQEQLARLTVVAPFDGVVVRKLTEVGQWVDQGDGVAEIISRGQIDALIDVSEAAINQVHVGDQVQVLIQPLTLSVVGQVVIVNPKGSAAARTFPVKIRLDDMNGRLKPAMSVLVKVPLAQKVDVLTVPSDAVQQSSNGAVVWVDQNRIAVPVAVQVLFSEGDRLAIERIGPGEPGQEPQLADQTPVVIEGAERLFPGRSLRVVPSADP